MQRKRTGKGSTHIAAAIVIARARPTTTTIATDAVAPAATAHTQHPATETTKTGDTTRIDEKTETITVEDPPHARHTVEKRGSCPVIALAPAPAPARPIAKVGATTTASAMTTAHDIHRLSVETIPASEPLLATIETAIVVGIRRPRVRIHTFSETRHRRPNQIWPRVSPRCKLLLRHWKSSAASAFGNERHRTPSRKRNTKIQRMVGTASYLEYEAKHPTWTWARLWPAVDQGSGEKWMLKSIH